MKKTIISLAILASTNIYASQTLFEVESINSPMSLQAFQKSQTLLSSTQFLISQTTERLSLPIDGRQVEFKLSTSAISASGNTIWQGNSKKGGNVTLIKSAKGITGTVHYANRLFKLSPSSRSGHILTEIDQLNLPAEHNENYIGSEQKTAPLFSFSALNNVNEATTQVTASTDIKLLVVYTAAAKSKVADINSLIDLAITETNTGYQNSGVNATVSLAHKAQVNYSEHSTSSVDLTRLAATNDGYMDEVHTLRDQYAADVVVLVNDVNGYCGQADAIGANAQSAFVIVDYDCATGYYSFGHEIGHLQGARHNPENDPTTTPYSFGHGYQDPQSRWRSVMAYNCTSGCTRINYWSNPNKTYNGDSMGTSSDNDNARVLNLTSPTIANFRTGTVEPPVVTVLEQNQSILINDNKGGEKLFSFNVPQGATNISIATSGGSGDADLHVKYGTSVSASNYDCRPWKNGNTESCPLTQTGDYAIMVSAYADYSNVSIVGSYTLGGSQLPIIINESNLSANKNEWLYFTVEALANASNISATMSGGSGDADLYINKGSKPTSSDYDCRSWNSGNSESCSRTISAADTWHVAVHAYSTFSAASLEIKVD